MWYIIVTFRGLFYVLCSIGATMVIMASLATPKWLIGRERSHPVYVNKTFRESVGIYNRCAYVPNIIKMRLEENCGIYAKTFQKIDSVAWQACIVFLGISIILLAIAAVMTSLTFCKQICFRKSLFNLAGVVQAIAGLFLVLTLAIYPVGWKTERIKRLCFEPDSIIEAKEYRIGHCELGISFYFAIGGCAASFLCAFLAGYADKSVFSYKVQEEILEGKHLICQL